MEFGFVPDIEGDFIVEEEAFGYHAEFLLGTIPDQDLMVVMSILLLDLSSWGQTGVHDIEFGIRTKKAGSSFNVSDAKFTKEDVDKYIHKYNRQVVLSLILRGIGEIITKIQPERVSMQSYYPDLPGKALVKYGAIESFLNSMGFDTEDKGKHEDGTHYWIFYKTP